MENTDRGVIFLHLPKNAGTTLNMILGERYAKNEIFQVEYNEDGIWNLEEFKALPQQEKDKFRLLTGHFNFGLHRHFTSDFDYITMLRHPVERTISFYNHVKRQKEHRLLEAVQGKSLIDCVTQVKDFDVVNGQARKLSDSEDESLMLKKALENIDGHFKFVGIQEFYDESMVLLNHKMQLGIKSYDSFNAAGVKRQIDPDLIKEIEKTNQVDLELYEILKDRFLLELDNIKFKSIKLKKLKATNKIKGLYHRFR